MRILHVVNHLRSAGDGIVNVAVDLACGQACAGNTIAVASSGGEYETLLEAHNVSLFPLRLDRVPAPVPFRAMIASPVWFRRIIRGFLPDVVHVHTAAGLLLATTFRRTGEYALVSHLHNEFERKATLMGRADVVIAVSHATAASAVRRGIPVSKVRTVLNGTVGSFRQKADESALRPEGEAPCLQGRPVVCVAGMFPRKGIDDVIAAFAELARRVEGVHLYLVGAGAYKPRLEAMAAETAAADRIHFLGLRPDVRALLNAADVFVNAAYREPCSLAIIEAIDCNCPIVATSVDGSPELLGYGRAGLLVAPGDRHALAEAMQTILTNPSERERIRAGARERVPCLAARRVADETLRVYEEALGKAAGSLRPAGALGPAT